MFLQRCLVLIVAASTTILQAQTTSPVMLVGAGYSLPPSAVAAAPGQIFNLSVYGIRRLDPALTIPSPANTPTYPPNNVAGVSVMLIQQAQPQQTTAPLFGIQQNKCAADANCQVVSTITLAIPLELQTPSDGSNPASLRIFDQGTALADIPLRPVTDNIHIISTCDQTPVYVSLFYEVAGIPGGCTPLVQHGGTGMLVTNQNPAKVGEMLTVWAYGLGAATGVMLDGIQRLATAQNVALSFNAQPNAPPIRPIPSADVTHPQTSLLVTVPGFYQLNIVVPPYLQGPFVPCDSLHVQSNLTITLSGAASSDAAPICVAN